MMKMQESPYSDNYAMLFKGEVALKPFPFLKLSSLLNQHFLKNDLSFQINLAEDSVREPELKSLWSMRVLHR